MRRLKGKKLQGFTLAEMMTVLAIIGIIISLALPNLLPLITKTKSLEAQIQLKHLLQLEKTYYFTNSKYSTNLTELGFEQTALVSEGGKANYKIEVTEASHKSFTAVATSITDFDSDGQLNSWQVDQTSALKEITAD
jgi:type IV pilus assembly protein PilE